MKKYPSIAWKDARTYAVGDILRFYLTHPVRVHAVPIVSVCDAASDRLTVDYPLPNGQMCLGASIHSKWFLPPSIEFNPPWRISWSDSAGQPSLIHATMDGIDTMCGEHDYYIANRALVRACRKHLGRSRYCSRCFCDGVRHNIPWDSRCIQEHDYGSGLKT